MRSRIEPGGWQANNVAVVRVGLVDDPQRVGRDDLGARDPVDVPPRQRRDDHLVAGHELVEVVEVGVAGSPGGRRRRRCRSRRASPCRASGPARCRAWTAGCPRTSCATSPIAGISIVPTSMRGSVDAVLRGRWDGHRQQGQRRWSGQRGGRRACGRRRWSRRASTRGRRRGRGDRRPRLDRRRRGRRGGRRRRRRRRTPASQRARPPRSTVRNRSHRAKVCQRAGRSGAQRRRRRVRRSPGLGDAGRDADAAVAGAGDDDAGRAGRRRPRACQSRWCGRYCGNAARPARHRTAVGLEVEPEVAADLGDGAVDERVVVEVVDRQAVAARARRAAPRRSPGASGPTSASRTTPP